MQGVGPCPGVCREKRGAGREGGVDLFVDGVERTRGRKNEIETEPKTAAFAPKKEFKNPFPLSRARMAPSLSKKESRTASTSPADAADNRISAPAARAGGARRRIVECVDDGIAVEFGLSFVFSLCSLLPASSHSSALIVGAKLSSSFEDDEVAVAAAAREVNQGIFVWGSFVYFELGRKKKGSDFVPFARSSLLSF